MAEKSNDIINEFSNSIKPNLIRLNMPATEIIKSSPKYLVVDDEINAQYQKERFEKKTGFSLEYSLFVKTYEEALEAIESNPNIIICFVDIRIPLNTSEKYEKDNGEYLEWDDYVKQKVIDIREEYGVKLLEKIRVPTVIGSAYIDRKDLQKEAEKHNNVIGLFGRPYSSEDFLILEPYHKYFRKETLQVNVISNSGIFDYSLFDDDTVSFVRSRSIEIKKLAKRGLEDIINIGNYLIQVKDRLGHGYFRAWIKSEFNWTSVRTASKFMNVAKKFKCADLAHLNILPSALYDLAAPSMPEDGLIEALARAELGQTITVDTVKEIKAQYKSPPQELGAKVQTENNDRKSLVSSGSQEVLPLQPKQEKKPKQEILGVVPSQKAVKNSWWQLGEHNKLFCGEPKSNEFLKRLPKDIGLSMTFLPKGDLLVPPIESIVACTFHLKYEDIDLDSAIETLVKKTTESGELVVFNYLYHIELLEVTEKIKCHFIVAEPDLEKCEQILTMWREKGSVMRITN